MPLLLQQQQQLIWRSVISRGMLCVAVGSLCSAGNLINYHCLQCPTAAEGILLAHDRRGLLAGFSALVVVVNSLSLRAKADFLLCSACPRECPIFCLFCSANKAEEEKKRERVAIIDGWICDLSHTLTLTAFAGTLLLVLSCLVEVVMFVCWWWLW